MARLLRRLPPRLPAGAAAAEVEREGGTRRRRVPLRVLRRRLRVHALVRRLRGGGGLARRLLRCADFGLRTG